MMQVGCIAYRKSMRVTSAHTVRNFIPPVLKQHSHMYDAVRHHVSQRNVELFCMSSLTGARG